MAKNQSLPAYVNKLDSREKIAKDLGSVPKDRRANGDTPMRLETHAGTPSRDPHSGLFESGVTRFGGKKGSRGVALKRTAPTDGLFHSGSSIQK